MALLFVVQSDYLLSIFFYQNWVDCSTAYEHKSDAAHTIREKLEDKCATEYGRK